MSDTDQKYTSRGRGERPAHRREGKSGERRFTKKKQFTTSKPERRTDQEKEFRRLPEGFDASFGIIDKDALNERADAIEKSIAKKKEPKKPKPFDRTKVRSVPIKAQTHKRKSAPRPAPRNDGIPTHEFIIQEGTHVVSPRYGEGTITAIEGNDLTISFEDNTKTYRIPDCIMDGSLEIL